jgi:hypothetical protein
MVALDDEGSQEVGAPNQGLMRQHARDFSPGVDALVFTTRMGEPVRRTTFRARVWRPALVRAGLMGESSRSAAPSTRRSGRTAPAWGGRRSSRPSEMHFTHVIAKAARFHDLRH